MSVFNGILRKPHQPRELEIRSLIKDLNLRLPPKPENPSGADVEEVDEFDEENPESEAELTDDECHLSDLYVICANMHFLCLFEKMMS